MSSQPRLDESQSMARIVGDIVADVQQLLRQEIALAKTEVRQTWVSTKKATIGMVVGGALVGVGLLLLTLCLVRALEAAGLSLWASYGAFALLYLIVGGAALAYMKNKTKEIHPVPRETVETMQENIQWLKKQR